MRITMHELAEAGIDVMCGAGFGCGSSGPGPEQRRVLHHFGDVAVEVPPEALPLEFDLVRGDYLSIGIYPHTGSYISLPQEKVIREEGVLEDGRPCSLQIKRFNPFPAWC